MAICRLKSTIAPAAQTIAINPSTSIILKKVFFPSYSLFTVLEINVACEPWKPERIPHATVTKNTGIKDCLLGCAVKSPPRIGACVVKTWRFFPPSANVPINTPIAERIKNAPKIG